MIIEITEEPMTSLQDYARVPIIFTVESVYDVDDRAGRYRLSERSVDVPYEKDYDAIAGEAPLHWGRRFNLSNWLFLSARGAARVAGGAAVAFDTPEVTMLEGRRDLAVLWDIRVAPDARRQGVGTALFESVESWARRRGCRQLKIETQNTNVQACRFYARQGCELGTIDRMAYSDRPDEIQLLWYKDLLRAQTGLG